MNDNIYSTISCNSIAFAHFSNLHKLGTKRDTSKELVMNSIDIRSISRLDGMLFCRISLHSQVREV